MMTFLDGLEKEVIHLNPEGKGFVKYHTRRAANAELWSVQPVFHHLTAPDHYYPHDHPFSMKVWVLQGGYTEESFELVNGKLEFRLRTRIAGDFFILPATHIHRIIDLIGPDGGECLTVCLYGPPEREWRFWRDDQGRTQYRIWNQEEWKDLT